MLPGQQEAGAKRITLRYLFNSGALLLIFPIKTLFQNISLAVVLNLLIKSAWILVNNIVQDRIGHTDFGSYAGLYALGFLFIAFSDLGLNQYATKTIAGDQGRLKDLFPGLFTLKILLTLVYPVFMIGAGWLLGYEKQQLIYLFVLCLTQALVQIIFFFRANFQAFQKFRIDALASVLDRAVLLVIVILLLVTDQINLDSYIIAGLVSVATAMILLYLFILRMFGWIRPVFKFDNIRRLLRASFPFAVITVMYSVMDKVDQVMLERMAGPHETGLYVGAYRWVDATMMYLWTVLPIFFAKFAFHIKDNKALARLLDFGQGVAALPMIFAGVFVFFYGDKLLFLFTQSSPEELKTMEICLRVLFISVLINGIFAVYSTLLTSTNHEKFVSWIIFAGILLNVLFNYLFIPKYGAVASAWTTLGSYFFLGICYMVYIQIKLPFDVPWKKLAKILLAGGTFALGFFGLSLTGLPWWLVSILGGMILGALGLTGGFVKFGKEIEE